MRKLFFVFMYSFTHTLVSSDVSPKDASPEIIIRKVTNETPFTVCLVDRHTQDYKHSIMSPSSVAVCNYLIDSNSDIPMDDLGSNDPFVKNNYFSHRARFKIALLDRDGKRKEGTNSYAHIAVKSDCTQAGEAVMTFRYAHPQTVLLRSNTWELSRCKSCNSGRVVEIGCADCKQALENSIACKPVTLDVQLNMKKKDILDDTGRVSFALRVKQK